MWKYKFIGIALYLKAISGKLDFEAARLGAVQDRRLYTIEKLNTVRLMEISGLTVRNDTVYALTDSGGEDYLYRISDDITILDSLLVPNASNKDWEALTSDNNGNFYVGDIGNNLSRRKDLRIFKFNKERTDTIHISYGQQQEFPPDKKHMNYDGEALFWSEGKLHLFSKNRGKKCVKHYVLDDEKGSVILWPGEEIKLNAMITGAAVSPDGTVAVLIGYGKIYFFKKTGNLIFNEPIMIIETTRFAQNEAVTFLDGSTLLVSNEKGKFFKVTFELPKKN